jgi:hypothetical protein
MRPARVRRAGGGRKKLTETDPTLLNDLKELVGDFKNAGRELRPKGEPEPVRVDDCKIPELGRTSPYGVYDIAGNTGWVSVGTDHDTASFAVNAIRRWWLEMGRKRYPDAKTLLITADRGGGNGVRVDCGSGNRKISPMNAIWRSPFATRRPVPANGTRLSTGCSRSSHGTGAASLWSATRPLSN